MSTDFTNGWLYDYQDNHFAPKSFMSLIYDQDTGRTLSKFINDEIYEKLIKIDISHAGSQSFKDMDDDLGWPGITGAVENGIAYGTASECLDFLSTPNSPTLFLTGSSNGTPTFNTLLFNINTTGENVGIQLCSGSATDVVTEFNFPVASATTSGIVTNGDQTFDGLKIFDGGIQGTLDGNASSASAFANSATITLTGDVNGTVSSTFGWIIPTTLDESGVTAGSYGTSIDSTPGHGGTFNIPAITVDDKGRITEAKSITITLPTDNNTDTKVSQVLTSANSEYPILLSNVSSSSSRTITSTSFTRNITVNPSTGALTVEGATTLNGSIIIGAANYGYGTELPASGSPGQIFFLLVD